MMICIDSFDGIFIKKLMDIYREGNEQNAAELYPQTPDRARALRRVEDDFVDYLRNVFYRRKGNMYCVYESGGTWVSALRLYLIEPCLYYIEAVETHPAYRRRGFAERLMLDVLEMLKAKGSYRVCDCVSKTNTASLAFHAKCGFDRVSERGLDYIENTYSENCCGMEYVYTAHG